MRTIGAAEFKERCLQLLDEVDDEGLLITKHGKPVARVLPAGSDGKRLIGSLRGKIRIKGNIVSTGVRWDAQS